MDDIRENQTLMGWAQLQQIPLAVTVEVTFRCNLRCVHCLQHSYHGGTKGELALDQFRHIFDALADLGCMQLLITGGEPFTRSDIVPLLQYASERLGVIVYSNGTMVTPGLAEQLSQMNLLKVEFSVYGSYAATHDQVTRVPGSFQRTLTAIRLLKDLDVRVSIKSIAIRETLSDLSNIARLAQREGIPYAGEGFVISPTIDGGIQPLAHRVTDELLQQLHNLRGLIKKANRDLLENIEDTRLLLCGMGRRTFHIDPTGNVFPCANARIFCGNAIQLPLARIWKDSPVLQSIRAKDLKDFSTCAACEYVAVCPRCPGLALSEHGDLYGAPTEICRLVRKAITLPS